MKTNKISFENIPKTPKKKEGGQMFINYLFNIPKIFYITDEQASIINESKNWNNIESLSNIFKVQKEWYEIKLKEKNNNLIRPPCKNNESISFFLSLFNEDNNKKNEKVLNDDLYDID